MPNPEVQKDFLLELGLINKFEENWSVYRVCVNDVGLNLNMEKIRRLSITKEVIDGDKPPRTLIEMSLRCDREGNAVGLDEAGIWTYREEDSNGKEGTKGIVCHFTQSADQQKAELKSAYRIVTGKQEIEDLPPVELTVGWKQMYDILKSSKVSKGSIYDFTCLYNPPTALPPTAP